MDLAERNRLIAVTKGFRSLQGLLYAPMGMFNAAMAVANSLVVPNAKRSLTETGAVVALFLCAFAATFAAWSYYRRRFGVVRSKCRGGVCALPLTVAAIVAILTLVAATYMDGTFYEQPVASYPVSFTCLWWALFYLAHYLYPYRVRPHSLWFAALFLGLCFLTLIGVAPKSQFLMGSGSAGNMLIWLAFSLHGLLDHLLLLRLLPKASPEQATSESGEQHG